MLRPLLLLGLALALFGAVVLACGTDAVAVDQCRQIETARCQTAAGCANIPISTLPLHSGSDVDSCIRYYNDACLHGFVNGANPGAVAVNACIAAIDAPDGAAGFEPDAGPGNVNHCEVVTHPERANDCAFLSNLPPVDAGVDAWDAFDGADAATE